MNYQDISKVNSEISMIDLKGKNYAMVPERVTAFRKLYPEGFIRTDIISHDGTTIMMQAQVGYYREDGTPVILSSGFAQEVKGKGIVNGTSYVENCETSAVGRALGMIGLGLNGGGICSAEELVNAITAQNQMKKDVELKQTANDFVPPKGTNEVTVTTAEKLPELSEEMKYLNSALVEISKYTKLSIAQVKELFQNTRKRAVEDGVAPNKALSSYSKKDIDLILDLMKAGSAA